MKCLVTGGTGFIGRALCGALASEGLPLCILSRSAPVVCAGDVIVHDLCASLPAGSLTGVDTIYHLAGEAHRDAPAGRHAAVNRDATVRLAQAAADAGVRRFIFLSSVRAMGECDLAQARAEEQLLPPGDSYGASKRDAEVALEAICRQAAMELCILRPALVYDRDAPGKLAQLSAWARRGLPAPPPVGGRSMVSRDDLVRLLLAVRTLPLPVPVTWIVSDGEVYSTQRLYRALARFHGRARCWPSLPEPVWRMVAALQDRRRSLRPGTTARALLGYDLYTNSALLAATDWRPRDTFEGSLGLESFPAPNAAASR